LSGKSPPPNPNKNKKKKDKEKAKQVETANSEDKSAAKANVVQLRMISMVAGRATRVDNRPTPRFPLHFTPPSSSRVRVIDALPDTGATMTVLPATLLGKTRLQSTDLQLVAANNAPM
jgi:hypothetical protein